MSFWIIYPLRTTETARNLEDWGSSCIIFSIWRGPILQWIMRSHWYHFLKSAFLGDMLDRSFTTWQASKALIVASAKREKYVSFVQACNMGKERATESYLPTSLIDRRKRKSKVYCTKAYFDFIFFCGIYLPCQSDPQNDESVCGWGNYGQNQMKPDQ